MLAVSSKRLAPKIFIVSSIIFSLILGLGVGIALAETVNVARFESFENLEIALPSKLYDRNGEFVTEFAGAEKRELISIDDLPRHLIHALLTREDDEFFQHRGFSVKGTIRAALSLLSGGFSGGGSTITQQLAGALMGARDDFSIWRKLKELWKALQLERRYTKNEILELYLNNSYFGSGVYGVEAAAKYYFKKSAKDLDVAESVLLIIQPSSVTGKYNPFKNPNLARERQWQILSNMVDKSYVTLEEAKASFDAYWSSYDYTRSTQGAFFMREDKAPWFSEYIRGELQNILFGSRDMYRDGYVIHSTLDLKAQAAADAAIKKGLDVMNRDFKAEQKQRNVTGENEIMPIINMLTIAFDLSALKAPSNLNEIRSTNYFTKQVAPVVDISSMIFGMPALKDQVVRGSYESIFINSQKNTVQGALIALDVESGHIIAMVGGSQFEPGDLGNENIRAIQGKMMPGSAFKPLYYSAALDKGMTEATTLYDEPIIFYNTDGSSYTPNNYRGTFYGPVPLWFALAQSLNIPALKVLETIGFDAAINRAAALLGITDPKEIVRTFPRYYPMGLGTIGVTPIKMARAYAVFANGGREVTPIGITTIEDRNGRIIIDVEGETRISQRAKGASAQIISPQNAYLMNDLLQNVTKRGTLGAVSNYNKITEYTDPATGKKYMIPLAGKTGTTQNWADTWTVGYSPYYSCAVWFGFDLPGNSLGVYQGGGVTAGQAWADFMGAAHKGLPMKDFPRPDGIYEMTVCAKTGKMLTPFCNEGTITLSFKVGTGPDGYCDYHEKIAEGKSIIEARGSSYVPDIKLDDVTIPDWLRDGSEPPPTSPRPGSTPRPSPSPSPSSDLLFPALPSWLTGQEGEEPFIPGPTEE
jgi:penicillin-binding protein 1A